MIKKFSILLLLSLFIKSKLTIATVFTNSSSITIVDESPASLYPATITASGLAGSITNVTITLNGVTHSNYNDVSIVLLGPNGESIMLQNGISSNNSTITNVTYTFADGSPLLPASNALTNGTYRPTNYLASEQFDSPAPPPPAPAAPGTYFLPGPTAGGVATLASVFGGSNPNGQWKLFIQDFAGGDAGIIAGGWSINISTAVALPIKLGKLSVLNIDCNAQLNWNTEEEINVDYFEIERSANLNDFETIATVKAFNANYSNYKYTDASLRDGKFQYRLKVVDIDRKVTFTESVAVDINCVQNEIKLFPNPSTSNSNLSISSSKQSIYNIKIVDGIGNTIFVNNVDVFNATKLLNLPTETLSAGIYSILVSDGKESKVIRFQKAQ